MGHKLLECRNVCKAERHLLYISKELTHINMCSELLYYEAPQVKRNGECLPIFLILSFFPNELTVS